MQIPWGHQLTASVLRFHRSVEIIYKIKADFADFCSRNEPNFLQERIEEKKMISYRVNVQEPLPAILSLQLGEAVYNLRCSLDYIATALTVMGRGNPRRSQFPICDDPQQFSESATRWLAAVPEFFLSIFERHQLYHSPGELGLAQLRDLSNTDKHRQIIASMALPQFAFDLSGVIDFIDADLGAANKLDFPPFYLRPEKVALLKNGDEVLRALDPEINGGLVVKPALGFAFGPGEVLEGWEVVSTLFGFCGIVEGIIKDFAKEIDQLA